MRPKTLYTHIFQHTYFIYIQCLWLQDPAADRIHFIILNQAAGRTKFDRGPDLARGPDFGHTCPRKQKDSHQTYELKNIASNQQNHS